MVNVGERIRDRRKELGYSADYLADRLDVSRSTIFRYENGEIDKVPIEVIKKLAVTLSISPSYLMGWDDNNNSEIRESNSTYNYFDIGLSAGILSEVDPFSDDDIEKVKISDVVMGKYAGDKDVFMTNINGQSMNRVIPDKSLIAVKEYDSIQGLQDGDIVVFQDGSEMSVKRFFNDKNNNVIVFNPDSTETFPPIVYQYANLDQLRIIGKVVVYTVEI